MTGKGTKVLPYGPEAIAEAAALIRAGEPVAVPTETVYGLAADATDAKAVARIYAAKGRPSFNPLIVHVLDADHAWSLGARPSAFARHIMDSYWPDSPLTLVVPLSPFATLAPAVTAGLGTVALRSPSHPAMRALIEASGRPLAAPSANRSGTISPTSADHVLRTLEGHVPLIIDGGPTTHGIESTILKIIHDEVSELRAGPVDAMKIAVLAKLAEDFDWGGKIEAPGQMASHYAPSKPLRLNALERQSGEWLIGFGAVAGDDNLSESGDLVEAAARLFAALHRADEQPAAAIAVAPIPDDGIGRAINDRLARAAAPRP